MEIAEEREMAGELAAAVAVVTAAVTTTVLRAVFVLLFSCLLCVSLVRILVYLHFEQEEEECENENQKCCCYYVRPWLHCRPSSLSQMLIKSVPGLSSSRRRCCCCCCCYPSKKWTHSLLLLLLPHRPSRPQFSAAISSLLMLQHAGRQVVNFVSACLLLCAKCDQHAAACRLHFIRQHFRFQIDSTTTSHFNIAQLDWVDSARLKRNISSGIVVILVNDKDQIMLTTSTAAAGTKFMLGLSRELQLHTLCRSLVDHGGYAPVIYRQTAAEADGVNELRQVVRYLSSRYPHTALFIFARSLSASLLVCYLGEFGSSSLVQAAVAVCPIWSGCQMLSPLADADDIAVPLLVVHYDDDPAVPASSVPRDLFTLYPHILLVTCPVGGHCGSSESTPFIDLILADFLSAILTFNRCNNRLVNNHRSRVIQNKFTTRRRISAAATARYSTF